MRFEPVAVDELLEAYDWLERRSPVDAYRWFDGLMGVVDSLERFPYRCPIAPYEHGFSFPVRQMLYGKGRNQYRILFRIEDDVVDIVHIRHAARAALPPPDDE